ncbi:hypothetical protein CONPUDRAFT_105062 [Coniophora puteana RWD-64-598 SS2]|uniref:C3H1-type domain-containing protein n=1 Tax=Coniophora puteana (strain RWD-64-598) TaxID=741705 RepID=A0A5M3MN47_CONPW|nr:uncharacterized protein CONPUDRAFT_105062 [Coniophora puteana RWD-64-598 SS2]EIW80135.1 hypothetical protein CONPUDRAFT_105062 [Coniophora puteana RWD-64-598 SS2]
MPSPKSSICYQFADTGTCRFGDSCKFKHTARSVTSPRGGSHRKRSNVVTSRFEGAPLDDFFTQYLSNGFDYNPHNSSHHEYRRLCRHMEWDRYDPEREEAREQFKDALTQQFSVMYGEDENELAAWQSLCEAVELDGVPDNLDECRDAIRFTFVNLVDLVDTQRTGNSVERFDSEVALSSYTMAQGKFFPADSAYQTGLLRYLLRHILSPDAKYRTSRGKNSKGQRRR